MNVLRKILPVAVAGLLAASCAVGPDYKKPDVAPLTPGEWSWTPAHPRDAAPKGSWWEIFQDPVLNEMETNAVVRSQTARAGLARVEQARATARLSRSQLFPELDAAPTVNRQLSSGNLPTPIPFHIPAARYDTFSMPLDLSYEIDVWGRVRRGFEGVRATAQATAADYQNVVLTLTADVAVDYFLLRSQDAQIRALTRRAAARGETSRLLRARLQAGAIAEVDVAQAEADAAAARSDLTDMIRQRAETLHALALLSGAPASSFTLAEASLPAPPPEPPADLPAMVLERRPDIASAERNVASKSAQIGVAKGGYFPVISLTAQGGYLSSSADKLFAGDSRVWSIGPSVSLPIFNGGRTSAEVKQAVANYRQAVLTAFKEVEDSLAQIRRRGEQETEAARAVEAARRGEELARARQAAGETTHLPVSDAERTLRQQELLQAQVRGEHYAAVVRLIKALGGGWSAKP